MTIRPYGAMSTCFRFVTACWGVVNRARVCAHQGRREVLKSLASGIGFRCMSRCVIFVASRSRHAARYRIMINGPYRAACPNVQLSKPTTFATKQSIRGPVSNPDSPHAFQPSLLELVMLNNNAGCVFESVIAIPLERSYRPRVRPCTGHRGMCRAAQSTLKSSADRQLKGRPEEDIYLIRVVETSIDRNDCPTGKIISNPIEAHARIAVGRLFVLDCVPGMR